VKTEESDKRIFQKRRTQDQAQEQAHSLNKPQSLKHLGNAQLSKRTEEWKTGASNSPIKIKESSGLMRPKELKLDSSQPVLSTGKQRITPNAVVAQDEEEDLQALNRMASLDSSTGTSVPLARHRIVPSHLIRREGDRDRGDPGIAQIYGPKVPTLKFTHAKQASLGESSRPRASRIARPEWQNTSRAPSMER